VNTKPVPWKTDATADKTRFPSRPGSVAGSARSGSGGGKTTTTLKKKNAVPGEDDPWAHYDAMDRKSPTLSAIDDDWSEERQWATTNEELAYDPAALELLRTRAANGWRDDDDDDDGGSSSMGASTRFGGPSATIRAERARRRSKLADPGGTGESDVGGWANVPRMRLGGADPLGGPDRGRNDGGIGWGVVHNLERHGAEVNTLPRSLEKTDDAAENPKKPWETRGLHPLRRKQLVGGSDVITGLWQPSGSTWGGHAGERFKPDPTRRTAAIKAQVDAIEAADWRKEQVLSSAAVNGFMLDEGGSVEARALVEAAERSRRDSVGVDGLSAAAAAKLRREAMALGLA